MAPKLYRNFSTQEEIDAEYNVEFSVDDFSVYVDLYLNESARAREELECLLDVPFGPTLDETVDIFPATDPKAPILIFVHGGYWRMLSSKEFNLVAHAPVAAGYTVVVTNYSLCPKVSISEITRQSRAALAWLYSDRFPCNGDRKQIYVCGHSAGGHQTAMLLSTDWQGEYGLPQDIIKGGLSISGLFDLQPLHYSWLQPTLCLEHEIIRRESPLFNLPQSAPPLTLTVGGKEPSEFQRQSADYCEAWTDNGLTGEYRPLASKNHFDILDGFLAPDSEIMSMVQNLRNS
ncbi:MAG: alpha/beta hydrolase [Gammaproteobacteria bacterium]